MVYLFIFIALSIPVLLISWKSINLKGSHGFYRFFGWEAILLLIVFKIEYWFTNPLSINQIISWIFLFISLWFVLSGIIKLKKEGKQQNIRQEVNLYAFEKSSQLVTTGIYKYIRHPLYSSLILLAWGTYLKYPDWILLPVPFIASLLMYFTARADEKECINYFGKVYIDYMKKSKRFIPLIF